MDKQIDCLIDKILHKFKKYTPIICREFDDPRMDGIYVSITNNIYIYIGVSHEPK